MTKYACICGWIGSSGDHAEHLNRQVCPRCNRKTPPIYRVTFPIIPCPQCKTTIDVVLIGNNLYHCNRCGGPHFDNDPDDGGDYDTRDPGRRMEREERSKERGLQRGKRGR